MKKHHPAKTSAPSQRMLRIGEVVRHAVVEVFSQEGVHDPVLTSHVITFPEVRMSPDLRLATVYVMPLGGHDREAGRSARGRNNRWRPRARAKRVPKKFMAGWCILSCENF